MQLVHFLSCPHLHQPDNGDYWVRYVTLLICRARRDLTAVPLSSPPPILPPPSLPSPPIPPSYLLPSLTQHYAVDSLGRRLLRWLQRSSVCPRWVWHEGEPLARWVWHKGEEALLLLPLAGEDVLDTWFSSALSIFGWPDQVCHAP